MNRRPHPIPLPHGGEGAAQAGLRPPKHSGAWIRRNPPHPQRATAARRASAAQAGQGLGLILLLLCFVHGAIGQGAVDFRNGAITFATTADRRVYWCGRTLLVGTNYVAALYYLPGSDQGAGLEDPHGGILARGSNTLAYAQFRAPGTSLPGVWLNGPAVGFLRYLQGVQPGASATLQVRVWDITVDPDFPSAFARGQYYASAPFNYTVPVPDAPKESYYMENLRAGVTPCALLISTRRAATSFTLFWPEPFLPAVVLEEASTLDGSATQFWTPVESPYATNAGEVSVTIPVPSPDRFYRLHRR